RVFVVYVDMGFAQSVGPFAPIEDIGHVESPLINFLNRIMGPQDLFGFLTSRNSVKDLVLAQKTRVTIDQIKDLYRAKFIDRDQADEALDSCDCGPNVSLDGCKTMIEALKLRHRADQTYSNLMDVVRQLGSLRQERKNLVFFSNQLPRWRPEERFL